MKNYNIKFTGERLIPKLNKGTAFYYEHLARYIFSNQFVKNKIVLDAGCGTGYGSFILSNYGKAKQVIAIDKSAEAIQYAKEKYYAVNIAYDVDDITKLNKIKQNTVDITVSFEVIEHIKKQDLFLKQVKRVLKENGIFIVSTPNKLTYVENNPFHEKELSPEEFTNLLQNYFSNVKILFQTYELSQSIKELLPDNFLLEEGFSTSENLLYTQNLNINNSQFMIAICSDVKLPIAKVVNLNVTKVDFLDLSRGLISLSEQFTTLYSEVKRLQTRLNQIESSRLYQLIRKLANFP